MCRLYLSVVPCSGHNCTIIIIFYYYCYYYYYYKVAVLAK
jgi:hypothetical protein